MSYNIFKSTWIDCDCFCPECSIRLTQDKELGLIYLEFQKKSGGLWHRIKEAFKLIFNVERGCYDEIVLGEEQVKKINEICIEFLGENK